VPFATRARRGIPALPDRPPGLTMPTRSVFKALAAAALLLSLAAPALSHGLDQVQHVPDALERAAVAPAPGAPVERLAGQVRHVTIEDRVAGIVIEHYALELDDGTAVALKNVQGRDLDNG